MRILVPKNDYAGLRLVGIKRDRIYNLPEKLGFLAKLDFFVSGQFPGKRERRDRTFR
ncbi:MAG TPA: hypothetical protein IGS52_10880 [Oscillatoriaceae cyanobacterium M33_DOE_052]|nr:hypothetical protein [Oscillatoriaceae cyanobacterium M33_DOE_052]